MDSGENPKYELLSESAGTDQKRYRQLKREAQRAGAYTRFGVDEYVDREAVLAYQMEKERVARETRENRKAARENSSNRYGHIDSLKRIDVIIKKISAAIDERTPKLDSILDLISTEADETKRDDLSDQWDRLSVASQRSELKLQDALTRRKEIETEQKKKIEAALIARSRTASPTATIEKKEEDRQ